MDEAHVYLIVIIVGATAVGIGALLALDYSRKLRGIEPPPPYVPRENEIDVFASYRGVAGYLALAAVLGGSCFRPVHALPLYSVGAFIFMLVALKRHARSGVLIRGEVGLAVGEWLILLTVYSAALVILATLLGRDVPPIGWMILSSLFAAPICWWIGGTFPCRSKLWLYATLILLSVVKPVILRPDVFGSQLEAANVPALVESEETRVEGDKLSVLERSPVWQYRVSFLGVFVAIACIVITARTPNGIGARTAT